MLGFAPGRSALCRHLLAEGFSQEEIERGLHIDQVQVLPPEYNRQSKLRIEVGSENRRFDFNLTSDGTIPDGMQGDAS
jgi:hypothetical protein